MRHCEAGLHGGILPSRARCLPEGLLFRPSPFRRLHGLLLAAVALGHAARPMQSQEPAADTPTIHVNVQLVLLDASVEWKKTGRPVTGLRAGDFLVAEDGEPQVVRTVSQDELPLSLVFLFDLTDTVHPVLQHLANGAAEVLRQLRDEDEVAVMTFSSHTGIEQRFTRNKMLAREGLDAASASYDPHEPTFLFEDLWEASLVSDRSRVKDARRVQVWVTDGSGNDQDRDRRLAHKAPEPLHGEEQATAALLRSGAVVSVLLERSELHGTGRYGDLERFAALTGGPVLQATANDAATRLSALLGELRARYTLGYSPSTAKPDGTVCHIKVGLSPAFFTGHPDVKPADVVLRTRGSYVRSGVPAP